MPVQLSEGVKEFTVQLREPGLVRGAGFALEQRLVMQQGQAAFNEVLTLFVEFDPNGAMVTHRFAVIPSGVPLSVDNRFHLEHVGTAVSTNTGQVAHVYEIKEVQ
jgi:hypothetical protein